MRERFAQGKGELMRVKIAPEHCLHNLACGGAVRAGRARNAEAVKVVSYELIDSFVQSVERHFVGRQHQRVVG